jgi:hypothetical protein
MENVVLYKICGLNCISMDEKRMFETPEAYEGLNYNTKKAKRNK